MKLLKLFILPLVILNATVSQAKPVFKYKTPCFLEVKSQQSPQYPGLEDTCTVVETRTDKGFLKTRNIYSNKFSLTVKLRWDEASQKFMTWDSHNKYEYQWVYSVGNNPVSSHPATYVMPGVMVQDISWD